MTEPVSRVRIAIADDHQIFRDGLRRLLETEPGFEVVGEASDGEAAVRLARDTIPDVLLLDVAMPRMGGAEVLDLLQEGPTRILLLTAGIDADDLLRALQRGAHGVVLKDNATRSLIDGIHRVARGQYVFGDGVSDDLAQAVRKLASPDAPRYGLTAREKEIVAAIVEGANNRDIATSLGISLQTVKHHLSNIFDKTGVSTRLELALLAVRKRLTDVRP
ncbi:MAG: response regulator transcription factor [Vicinamibacterales bacterium]